MAKSSWSPGLRVRPPLRLRIATIVMMAATLAFVLQGIFVAASEEATGDSSHYYIGFALAGL